jgi:ATP synthase protein I
MQSGLTLLLAAIALLAGQRYAISTLAGGGAATIVNAAAAWLVFRPYNASAGASLMARFYTAEMLRLVLAATVFLFAVRWIDSLSIAAMLGAYLLIQLVTGAMMSLVNNLPTR